MNLSYYQQLADDLKKVIDPPEEEASLNTNLLTYKDENYQYSGLGDTFLEANRHLEAGRYLLKGYFKPAKDQYSSKFTIGLLEVEDNSNYKTISHRTPYQNFSKILMVYKTGHYNINVECNGSNKWSFSILSV